MSFFYIINFGKLSNMLQTYSINLYSLFLKMKISIQLKYSSKKINPGKRASLFISKKNRKSAKGTVTIEAAIIFPVFLTICIGVLYFIEVLRLESKVDAALYNTTKYYSQCMGVLSDYSQNIEFLSNYSQDNEDIEDIKEIALNAVGISVISKSVMDKLDDRYLEKLPIIEGKKSFSFLQSRISEEYLDIVVTYKIRLPVAYIKPVCMDIRQRCKMHIWCGKDSLNDSKNEEVVYVTSTGSVYHKTRDCTYLKLKIQSVKFSDVADKRNNSGAKYYPCEKCCKGVKDKLQVYITAEGTRYHTTLSCSKLKRTVYEIELSKVKDSKRPCSKCYGKS